MAFSIDIEGTPPTQAELDKVREGWEQEILAWHEKFDFYSVAMLFSFIGLLGSLIGFFFGFGSSHKDINFLFLWGSCILGFSILFRYLYIYKVFTPPWDLKEKMNELKEISPKTNPEMFTNLNAWGKKDEKIKAYFKAVAKQERLPVHREYEKAKVYIETLKYNIEQERNKAISMSQ